MSSDIQVLEAERVRLSLLEEKIKEVLVMLRTLNGMVGGSKAYDTVKKLKTVFYFLSSEHLPAHPRPPCAGLCGAVR